jgi:hypothetical protein
MAYKLKESIQIRTLVADLGIKPTGDPVADIIHYCEQRIDEFMLDFPDCNTLSQCLECVAGKVGTYFEEVHSDDELYQLKQKYIEQSEKGVANLEEELSADTFGITIRRAYHEEYEPPYVSIIDCRGDKSTRAYFTKWHEVAHLLVLTDQMRLSFKRTHSSTSAQDPEEILMDVIAGTFGFRPPSMKEYEHIELSFDLIDSLREELCPEASRQASVLGFAKVWPKPCVLLRAEMGYRKDQEAKLQQQGFYFLEPPSPSLRAVQVTINNAARDINFAIHTNMRVPEISVIHRVYEENLEYDEADEDLSWWKTSKGQVLPKRQIRVKARACWEGVEALILPLN